MKAQNRDFIKIYALTTTSVSANYASFMSTRLHDYMRSCVLSVEVWLLFEPDRLLLCDCIILRAVHLFCENTVNIFVPYYHCVINISVYLCDDFSPLSVLLKCHLAKLIGIRQWTIVNWPVQNYPGKLASWAINIRLPLKSHYWGRVCFLGRSSRRLPKTLLSSRP